MQDLRVQGIRTKENSKFLKFWAIVQSEAQKKDCVFFLDTGDGNEMTDDTINAENCFGWLIPTDKVQSFNTDFIKFKNLDKWEDFYSCEEWKKDKQNKIQVTINIL